MKKLMIAAAIVCAAAMSQAATYNWSGTMAGVYSDTAWSEDGALKSGLATYIFDSSVVDSAVLAAALAGGNLTGLEDALMGPFPGEDYGGFTKLGSGINGNAADTAVSAFVAIFNNADATKADYFWISEAAEGAIDDAVKGGGNALVDFGEQEAYAGSWTKIDSVPEPTSGLLLLLGVAGLALRRRRA